MSPWWRGFKGEIKAVAKHKYEVTGLVKKINDTTVDITELPIYKWIQPYKVELEAMMINEKADAGSIQVSFMLALRIVLHSLVFSVIQGKSCEWQYLFPDYYGR